MKFSIPPIKEPLFLSGTLLSPVWIKWFDSLFTAVQSTNDSSSTLNNMQITQREESTIKESSSMLNFIPKANDQSSNSPTESIGVDSLMVLIPKGKDQSTNDFTDMQTLYWMGV
jgi:hypothetical protein